MKNLIAMLLLVMAPGCVTTTSTIPARTVSVPVERVDPGTLIDFNDTASSERELRALLDQSDGAYKLEVLTQLARAQGLQGKFDEAHATLDQVEAGLADGGSLVKLRYLLERGRVFNSAGEPGTAAPLFEQAFEIGVAHGPEHLAIDAAHMVAIANRGEPEELQWGLKALALAEKSEDPEARSWLGPLYNNLGWTFHDAEEFEKALALFQKGLAVRRKQGDDGSIYLARWAVARCLRSLGRYQKALNIQTQLEVESSRKGEPDGFVFEELGELYLVRGDDDEAREWFAKALPLLEADEWLAEEEPERIERIRGLVAGAATTEPTPADPEADSPPTTLDPDPVENVEDGPEDNL
jgi:tetratricopeptide (TPR) repeat protein